MTSCSLVAGIWPRPVAILVDVTELAQRTSVHAPMRVHSSVVLYVQDLAASRTQWVLPQHCRNGACLLSFAF